MDAIERKAFIYTAQTFDGFTIDWQTGIMTPPKK